MTQPSKVQARKLKGFQDHHPEDQQLRYALMDQMRQEAFLAGFGLIETPALEYADVLLGYGGETDKQLFRFLDNGQRDVALRFDLTVPFARYVAEHQGTMIFPFKRCQMGSVWRAEKPQKGRYREFMQCDLDVVGVDSWEADGEIVLCFLNTLDRMGFGPFTMTLGHRGILSALIQHFMGALTPEQETAVLIWLDKQDKIGAGSVLAGLKTLELNPEGCEALMGFLEGASLEQVKSLFAPGHPALGWVAQLEQTLALVKAAYQGTRGRLTVNLSVARGLGYYTGLVFETTMDQLPGYGSICSGGRYHRLVERFTNQEIPGIGGSIGLDRLVSAMKELGHRPEASLSPRCFIAVAAPQATSYAYKIAGLLRGAGYPTDVNLKPQKLKNQLKLADRLQAAWVLTVGDEELQGDSVSLKHMGSGEFWPKLPLTQLLTHLQKHHQVPSQA